MAAAALGVAGPAIAVRLWREAEARDAAERARAREEHLQDVLAQRLAGQPLKERCTEAGIDVAAIERELSEDSVAGTLTELLRLNLIGVSVGTEHARDDRSALSG